MLRFLPWRMMWIGGLAIVAAVATSSTLSAQQPANKDPEQTLENFAEARSDAQPVYWIGVQCFDHTNVPKLQGLLVGQVVPGSPADKVGIQPRDVLVSVDDKPLAEVKDLSAAVNAAKDKEIRLEISRDGKPRSLSVIPALRPALNEVPVMPEPDRDALRQWIESLRAGHGQAPPLALRFFHPGIVVPAEPQLPDDMTLTITRRGKQPAKITVEQGDQHWEVTEDKLAELPAQVRAVVEPLITRRGPSMTQSWPWTPQVNQPTNPLPGNSAPAEVGPGSASGSGADADFEQRLERRLEELNRRMEDFHKRMDKWEQQLGPPQKSERSRP